MFIGAIIVTFWGVSHLIFTKGVVKDFGDISKENKLIITMEWIMEGLLLIFIGVLVMTIALIGGRNDGVSIYVYFISSIMLIIMAIVSLFTGARVNFLPYRLCPLIFTASAVLITIGYLILKSKSIFFFKFIGIGISPIIHILLYLVVCSKYHKQLD